MWARASITKRIESFTLKSGATALSCSAVRKSFASSSSLSSPQSMVLNSAAERRHASELRPRRQRAWRGREQRRGSSEWLALLYAERGHRHKTPS